MAKRTVNLDSEMQREWALEKGWKPVVNAFEQRIRSARTVECTLWSVRTHKRCGHRLRYNQGTFRMRHHWKHEDGKA